MKKLILKTALITFAAALVVVAAVFGICSLAAPATMSRFTASIGLDGLSGDYAYSAYQSTGDIEHLAYSAEVAAARGDASTVKKYEELFNHEGFSAYCEKRNALVEEGLKKYVSDYGQFSYGNYACALLQAGEGDKAITAVVDYCKAPLSERNALAVLAGEGMNRGDKEFCKKYADALKSSAFAQDEQCKKIILDLEGYANE